MHRTTKIATLSAALVLGVSGLAACGSSDEGSSSAKTPAAPSSSASSSSASPSASPSGSATPSTSAKPKTAMLTIKDYKYAGTTTVKPGTKITVTNNDSEAHTVTSDTGGAFNVAVPPGSTKTFAAPSKAGTYKFHCIYHSNMHGTITVG